MSRAATGQIIYRKLMPVDREALETHLISLDGDSRRARFGMVATDAFLREYATRCITLNATIYGAFLDDQLIGVAELRPMGNLFAEDAELAFSVLPDHRNRGIGSVLFGRVLRSARNRTLARLHMNCLRYNAPMRALARKFAAEIHVEHDQSVALVAAPPRSIVSLLGEALDDASAWPSQIWAWQRGAYATGITSKGKPAHRI